MSVETVRWLVCEGGALRRGKSANCDTRRLIEQGETVAAARRRRPGWSRERVTTSNPHDTDKRGMPKRYPIDVCPACADPVRPPKGPITPKLELTP